MISKELLNEEEASIMLGVSVGSLRRWRRERPPRGPRVTTPIGTRMVRYNRKDLLAYMDASATKSEPEAQPTGV